MKTRKFKIALFASLVMGCFLPISASLQSVNKVQAASIYDKYAFHGTETAIPEAYIMPMEGNKMPIIEPGYTDGGRIDPINAILLTDGGGSTYPVNGDNNKNCRRFMGFTLTTDAKLTITLYSQKKEFEIADYSGSVIYSHKMEVRAKETLTYDFLNVDKAGTTFYFGGANSNVFIVSIEFTPLIPKATFDANGGTFADGETSISFDQPSDTVTTMDKPSEVPTRDGYTFAYWSETVDGSEATTFEYGATYYAVWTAIPVESVSINNKVPSIRENGQVQLSATVLPEETLIKTITWTSSNPEVATIDATGLVKGVSDGSTTITASAGGKSDSYVLTVTPVNKYVVTFDFNDGTTADYVLPKVYENEKVTPPSTPDRPGFIITGWTLNGEEFDFNTPITSSITLVATWEEIKKADSIVINENDYLIKASIINKLTYTASRNDGAKVNVFEPLEWVSSDPSVISIDNEGVLTAHQKGSVTITVSLYESNEKITSAAITVTNNNEFVGGELVDTNLYVDGAVGRFTSISGEKRGVRFIASVSRSYFPYITSAKMDIEAIDKSETVVKTFSYTINTFSDAIEYSSITASGSLASSWSEEGMVGAAVTIYGVPKFGFDGVFKVKFSAIDSLTYLESSVEYTLEY